MSDTAPSADTGGCRPGAPRSQACAERGRSTPVAEDDQKYRIVRSPYYKPAELALARPYSRLADALADMGDGLVIAEDGHVAAFHERHERFVAHMSTPPAQTN